METLKSNQNSGFMQSFYELLSTNYDQLKNVDHAINLNLTPNFHDDINWNHYSKRKTMLLKYAMVLNHQID